MPITTNALVRAQAAGTSGSNLQRQASMAGPFCWKESDVELSMERIVASIAAILMLTLSCAHAGGLLSEQQARAKAIDILKGDPYGGSPAELTKIIKQVQLVQDGPLKACSAKKGPAWEFHVVVVTANKDQFNNGVIDGYLALDARTAKILCTNLPMLD
jgi:hypothetical protein